MARETHFYPYSVMFLPSLIEAHEYVENAEGLQQNLTLLESFVQERKV